MISPVVVHSDDVLATQQALDDLVAQINQQNFAVTDQRRTPAEQLRGQRGSRGGPGEKGDPGPIGPQGPGASIIEIDFTYQTSSPQTLFTGAIGQRIVNTELVIETEFDDVAATLTIGNAADNSAIMAASDNLPGTINEYSTSKNFRFPTVQDLFLFINPGSSTQGAGYAIIYFT